jgi:hypothetical protein
VGRLRPIPGRPLFSADSGAALTPRLMSWTGFAVYYPISETRHLLNRRPQRMYAPLTPFRGAKGDHSEKEAEEQNNLDIDIDFGFGFGFGDFEK